MESSFAAVTIGIGNPLAVDKLKVNNTVAEVLEDEIREAKVLDRETAVLIGDVQRIRTNACYSIVVDAIGFGVQGGFGKFVNFGEEALISR